MNSAFLFQHDHNVKSGPQYIESNKEIMCCYLWQVLYVPLAYEKI